MPDTLTIRLTESDRAILELDARKHGVGIATYVRALALSRVEDLRRERIRAGSAAVAAHVRSSRTAREELDDYGTPMADV